MKALFCKIWFCVSVILFLSFSTGFAADKKTYSTSPPAQAAKKIRIGYFQGGPYKTYQRTLITIIDGLAGLGWIEPVVIPAQENDKDTDKLWTWLASNVKSRYIEFVPDAYYSNNWNKETREQSKQLVLKRLKENKDIHLMIAMGTVAGQDLANDDHSVPTIVCEANSPVDAKIIKSIEDSGYDHIHARVDPKRYERQIRSFYEVIGFKKLGMAFRDTVEGRSIASVEMVKNIAKEHKFEVVECYTTMGESEEAIAKMLQCMQELSGKADAVYLVEQNSINSKTIPKILDILNIKKIATFSQAGADDVKQGVLLSISNTTYKDVGKFHAETIAKIINGAKPRELGQIYESPPKIAFNKATAKVIDLKDDMFQLLSKTAQEVYDKIETGK
jgi:ABC-type uncharacterized transport system substrate-binding protein